MANIWVVFEKEAWKVTGSATGCPGCVMSDRASDIPQHTPRWRSDSRSDCLLTNSVIVSYHSSKTASCQHAMARRIADVEEKYVGVCYKVNSGCNQDLCN